MGNMEDEEFYQKIRNLSRKELQGLCRIYGLPSDTPIDDIVKSMLPSLERKSSSSVSSREKPSGTKELPLPASSTPQLQHGARFKYKADAKKGSCGIISSPPEEEDSNEKCSQTGLKEPTCCIMAETHIKASGKGNSQGFASSRYCLQVSSHSQFVTPCDVSSFNLKKDSPKTNSSKNFLPHGREGGAGDLPTIQHSDKNSGASPAESASASSAKPSSSSKPPSSAFEYHVSSDKGINLVVDLNMSPSYWTERLKNEVYICSDVKNKRFRGIHEDLGQRLIAGARQDKSLSLWNKLSSCGANDDHVENGSLPSSSLRENSHMEDSPDVDGGSFMSCAVKACSIAVETLENLEEDQAVLISSMPSSDIQSQMISGPKTCLGDGGTATPNSSICSIPKVKTTCNYVVNSASDGSKILNMWEHQNTTLCTEIGENSILQNASSFVNPIVESGSMEIQLAEDINDCEGASFSPCGNGGILDLVEPKHNVETEHGGFGNSNVLNQETCRKHMALVAEEQEGERNLPKGRENKETPQVGNSSDKTCLKSDCSESIEGPHRKRKCNDGEVHGGSGKPDTKVYAENPSGEVLPRRSTRLISK